MKKKSRPMRVGSPLCLAIVISGLCRLPITWRTYTSSRSSAIQKRLPGYRFSLERKKQYLQSRLQMAPVGLPSTWK